MYFYGHQLDESWTIPLGSKTTVSYISQNATVCLQRLHFFQTAAVCGCTGLQHVYSHRRQTQVDCGSCSVRTIRSGPDCSNDVLAAASESFGHLNQLSLTFLHTLLHKRMKPPAAVYLSPRVSSTLRFTACDFSFNEGKVVKQRTAASFPLCVC